MGYNARMANGEWRMGSGERLFGHSRLAIRHSPIHTSAFLKEPSGLYDGPEGARLAARMRPVKRRGPLSTLIVP